MAFIHRFGSSLNRPVHLHVHGVDGVLEEVGLSRRTTLKQPQAAGRFEPFANPG